MVLHVCVAWYRILKLKCPTIHCTERIEIKRTQDGGVAVYVSDDVRCVRREDPESLEIESLWIELSQFGP